ncbi:MAG: aminomethyl-transferring glycine dehydrogenase [Kiritimatiellae bacterium]|nr:aminomethyl-transferring glycine dehydrogenase [Kiritimatiellia bacterium]MDW8458727.1 aminomethyl-transferring glycine dehydrogenase [Verrucomicrobiota bacterium]
MSELPFVRRHIGPQPADLSDMLATIGVASVDQLLDETIPAAIRRTRPLDLPEGESEAAYLARLREIAAQNQIFRSYIGLGYYGTVTPPVIQRCVLENPSWYTPYTPYQAEISQGRLEALINFQTMVADLTGLEIANASLLDEATAAAEAMAMMRRLQDRRGREAAPDALFVSDTLFPQTIEVLRGRAEPLGIRLLIGSFREFDFSEPVFGAIVQSPDADGLVSDLRSFIQRAHEAGALVAVATDLLALTLLTPPGELGADIAFGSAQRFGVPMGYGGPHAAFFAARREFVREMPGRIIGVSVDADGRPAYRMALQTREQHIRREKAKSNICTAQALLANIAGFYAVYHGPDGLRAIAQRVHRQARILRRAAEQLGYVLQNPYFFDTLSLAAPAGVDPERIHALAKQQRMNFGRRPRGIRLALDETTTARDLADIVRVLAEAAGKTPPSLEALDPGDDLEFHDDLIRSSEFLTHPVFHVHRSETAIMRYIKSLEQKDLGLDQSMIPLGSCTMKLNAAAEMLPITWPEFAALHPFAPADQAKGYAQIFRELEAALCEITGFPAVSLQPNAGSQGEYAGLLVIRAYHRARGQGNRNVVLIPASAHGTNPASAAMAGMEVVVVACDKSGHIDFADLSEKAARYADRLAALMITYPSTYGVFDDNVREICDLIHRHGGQVYLDGANLNAMVGLTSPALVGADVCHMNLHKTFAIPHGGGGPGMGPIAVAEHLAPFLPRHPFADVGGPRGIPAVSAAPWGSASILLISYGYIRLLGGSGMTEASRMAILNANYIKARLEPFYDVHYVGSRGRVAHELIFDIRPLKERSGIDETDVAKRLMDYGFHAPTVSWPVPGTLMVEPTESEPKSELDRFCDAMISIRNEIQAVIDGALDRADNPLKNAPHTAAAVSADHWPHAYTREQAAYPLPSLRQRKFWPSVSRVDNPYGDRHLVCSCPLPESYQPQEPASR